VKLSVVYAQVQVIVSVKDVESENVFKAFVTVPKIVIEKVPASAPELENHEINFVYSSVYINAIDYPEVLGETVIEYFISVS